MNDATRHDRTRSARFAVYGALLGLIVGIPLGVWLSGRGLLSGSPTAIAVAGPRPVRATRSIGADPLTLFELDGLIEPASSIFNGGPPKDGIPALLDPMTVPVDEADHLASDDRVIGVTIDGETRGYPIRLLAHHEIVNDSLGGVPIAVIYCPLCDSVSVVDRRIDDQTLVFGVTGLLINSNILMFDRTNDALWTQVGCRAISGPYAGRSLRHVNSWEIATFGAWSQRHPQGRVLSFETGYHRNYEGSPYGDYFENDRLYFPVPEDDRLPRRKTRVIGIRHDGLAVAVPLEAVRDAPGGRLEVAVGSVRVLLASNPSTREIAVIDHPDETQIVHTFWFAWAAFHPETTIFPTAPGLPESPAPPAPPAPPTSQPGRP